LSKENSHERRGDVTTSYDTSVGEEDVDSVIFDEGKSRDLVERGLRFERNPNEKRNEVSSPSPPSPFFFLSSERKKTRAHLNTLQVSNIHLHDGNPSSAALDESLEIGG